jgi:predicted DNA-binding transcriptional regulator AlpA
MQLIFPKDLPGEGVHKSRSQINRDIKAKRFPRPIYVGRTPAWLKAELDEWKAGLVAARDAEAAA